MIKPQISVKPIPPFTQEIPITGQRSRISIMSSKLKCLLKTNKTLDLVKNLDLEQLKIEGRYLRSIR